LFAIPESGEPGHFLSIDLLNVVNCQSWSVSGINSKGQGGFMSHVLASIYKRDVNEKGKGQILTFESTGQPTKEWFKLRGEGDEECVEMEMKAFLYKLPSQKADDGKLAVRLSLEVCLLLVDFLREKNRLSVQAE
jgi:hypothetical protein